MSRLEEELPRMARQPILFRPEVGEKLVWAWMRWYENCAPGMLRHMLDPERFDRIVREHGQEPLDENGEPWGLLTGSTIEEAFAAVGIEPQPELVAELREKEEIFSEL